MGGVNDVYKALADPTRRAIVDELRVRDGQSLFELCARLVTNHGLTSSRQAVSQHLTVLEAAGLVTTERQGRYRVLHLDTTALAPVIGSWPTAPVEAQLPVGEVHADTATVHRTGMRVTWVSLFVDDQEHARQFYTDVLGFVVKHDVALGGEARWLTVVSPYDSDGVELVLEPLGHPAAKVFRDALFDDGVPFNSFGVDDVDAEYRRLVGLGVHFTQPPAAMGQTTTAIFDDTCGNLIQIHHHHG